MIKLKNVTKLFNLKYSKYGMLGFIVNSFKVGKDDQFYALKNINLEIDEKEIVGVIGKNGSGKTTLLKILAGVIHPNIGSVETYAQPVYLSSFSNGINRNLTMLDNIFIIGTLNGLNKNQIKEKVKEIVDFSGLENFLNVPLYKFSSGMFSRFAFASMIFTLPKSPEILLLDEVLSAGSDDFFKEKIENKIKEYINSAKIVFIVNHNSNYILNNCSKVIWLENGEIKKNGGKEVVKDYLESLK
jgi:ABC-type polysaccharide/polyol phosphate transport system ATPase subunit